MVSDVLFLFFFGELQSFGYRRRHACMHASMRACPLSAFPIAPPELMKDLFILKYIHIIHIYVAGSVLFFCLCFSDEAFLSRLFV